MKLLHIDSSVLGPHSVSRQVSAAIVERLRKANPGLEVSYRDLTLTPLAHLSGPHLAAGQEAAPEPGLQADIVAGRTALEEFLNGPSTIHDGGFVDADVLNEYFSRFPATADEE